VTREPVVLGIETSCDETGIGIVRGTTLLANTIASSMDEHARYGGVVPEVAARAHLEALRPTLEAALAEAGVALDELDAIAVTSGPGLAGALMVGVGAAKALAISLGIPLYAVNHLVGHVGADLLHRPKRGFGAPIREWFRGASGEELGALIMNSSLSRRKLFDYKFIQRLLDEHQRGARDWSFHLWALLNVSLWYDRWIDPAV